MEVYTVSPAQMNDWKQICQAYADKKNAKLLFVNDHSCGLEYPDGSFAHVYLEDMAYDLECEKQQKSKRGKSNDYER